VREKMPQLVELATSPDPLLLKLTGSTPMTVENQRITHKSVTLPS